MAERAQSSKNKRELLKVQFKDRHLWVGTEPFNPHSQDGHVLDAWLVSIRRHHAWFVKYEPLSIKRALHANYTQPKAVQKPIAQVAVTTPPVQKQITGPSASVSTTGVGSVGLGFSGGAGIGGGAYLSTGSEVVVGPAHVSHSDRFGDLVVEDLHSGGDVSLGGSFSMLKVTVAGKELTVTCDAGQTVCELRKKIAMAAAAEMDQSIYVTNVTADGKALFSDQTLLASGVTSRTKLSATFFEQHPFLKFGRDAEDPSIPHIEGDLQTSPGGTKYSGGKAAPSFGVASGYVPWSPPAKGSFSPTDTGFEPPQIAVDMNVEAEIDVAVMENLEELQAEMEIQDGDDDEASCEDLDEDDGLVIEAIQQEPPRIYITPTDTMFTLESPKSSGYKAPIPHCPTDMAMSVAVPTPSHMYSWNSHDGQRHMMIPQHRAQVGYQYEQHVQPAGKMVIIGGLHDGEEVDINAEFEVEVPQIEAEIEVEVPSVEIEASIGGLEIDLDVDISSPRGSALTPLLSPDVEVEAPSVEVEAEFEVEVPLVIPASEFNVEVEAPSVEVEVPSVEMDYSAEIDLKYSEDRQAPSTAAPSYEAPSSSYNIFGSGASTSYQAPSAEYSASVNTDYLGKVEAPSMEVEVEAPSVEVEVETPSFHVEVPAVAVETSYSYSTKVEVEAPKAEVSVSGAEAYRSYVQETTAAGRAASPPEVERDEDDDPDDDHDEVVQTPITPRAPKEPQVVEEYDDPNTPRVPSKPVAFEGWLWKKGKGESILGRRNWKRRHIRLYGGFVSYAKDDQGPAINNFLLYDAHDTKAKRQKPRMTNATYHAQLSDKVLEVPLASKELKLRATREDQQVLQKWGMAFKQHLEYYSHPEVVKSTRAAKAKHG